MVLKKISCWQNKPHLVCSVTHGPVVVSWKSVVVLYNACVPSWHHQLYRGAQATQNQLLFFSSSPFLLLIIMMSDCSVKPLNICQDESQCHYSTNQMADARKPRSYMSALNAPCCCWVAFSWLEIKNVHSHELKMRLLLLFVVVFYSKSELHISREVLLKQCHYQLCHNSQPWQLMLTYCK